MNIHNIKWNTLLIGCLLLSVVGCNKADNFYQELHTTPELINDYVGLYETGDTLTLKGRLNPESNLSIKIGNTDVPIETTKKIGPYEAGVMLDEVKVVISDKIEGGSQPVTIISGGRTTEGPAIQIYSSKSAGYLSDKLELKSYAQLSSDIVFLSCYSGKGTVYYWQPGKGIERIAKDGITASVLVSGGLADTHGTFAIQDFYSGGLDKQERYLYFSALTTDNSTDNTDNLIFRFCKYDVQENKLTTLNRTLFPKNQELPIIQAEQPLTGQIGNVKLHGIGKIFPAANGSVYLQPATKPITNQSNWIYATALLTVDNNLSYIFREPNYRYGGDYTALIKLIPGSDISLGGTGGFIAADEGYLYTQTSQYDMAKGKLRYSYGLLPNSTPIIFGPLNQLTTGPTNAIIIPGYGSIPKRFGFMPYPDEKLIVLYYQGYEATNKYPAWGVLDFKLRRGDRYAPGQIKANDFKMTDLGDQLLNYDEEGMLYMSANVKTVLVKTVKQ